MKPPYRIIIIYKNGMKELTNSERLFGDKELIKQSFHFPGYDGEFWLCNTPNKNGVIYKEV